jgi:hypothetical protein
MLWTTFEQARREALEAGFATVADLHKGVDEALIALARDTGRFVYIGQRQGRHTHDPSIWRNPYGQEYGDRPTRVALYADYLDGHPQPAPRLPKLPGGELLTRLSALAGMVLCCWCAPAVCHGEELLRRMLDGSFKRYQAAVEAHRISPYRRCGNETPNEGRSIPS